MVYLEISRTRLGELGISINQIASILSSQNVVEDAGRVRVGPNYIRIHPSGESQSVQDMGEIIINSSVGNLVHLKDIAAIERAYIEVPDKLIYFNGKPALTIGISMQSGANVVAIGAVLDARLNELSSRIPLGMDLEAIYLQPVEVNKSVSSFIVSVAQAIAIVIGVLLLFMGLASGLIIGAVLLITVAGTLFIMQLYGIELQRISLGALVIALGMLVDNAIVVAEGMLVKIRAGVNAAKAASEVVSKTMWPLLGGTVIGILAFSAIGLSTDNTGEFASSLFYVILISLLLSWVTAVSTTPLLCAIFLKPDKDADDSSDPYGRGIFPLFRRLLKNVIRWRWATTGIVVGLFAIAIIGFGNIKSAFFPIANTPMFFIDVWEPEGTDIRETRDDSLMIADFIRGLPGVTQTLTVVGGGDVRFSLTYSPKEASAAYAQIIVQLETREQITNVWSSASEHMRDNYPHLDPIIKPFRLGPGRDGKIEARFHGPDPAVLRRLSQDAKAIMRQDSEAIEIMDDWRQPVQLVRPLFNETAARQLDVTRKELAMALRAAFEGIPVGVYRDETRLLP
ncbi:MAG: efflux RND transporter permease subunit, partial [Pseudomonadales bacterium]